MLVADLVRQGLKDFGCGSQSLRVPVSRETDQQFVPARLQFVPKPRGVQDSGGIELFLPRRRTPQWPARSRRCRRLRSSEPVHEQQTDHRLAARGFQRHARCNDRDRRDRGDFKEIRSCAASFPRRSARADASSSMRRMCNMKGRDGQQVDSSALVSIRLPRTAKRLGPVAGIALKTLRRAVPGADVRRLSSASAPISW